MRTLSLVSQKGGAGKTTLSLHLAVAAHMAGFSVAIADLDPQVSAWKWSERRKGEPGAIVQLNRSVISRAALPAGSSSCATCPVMRAREKATR